MPRVSRDSIEAIRQRVSLVDVAGLYTELKRVGSQYRGLSPFNAEKTPSFYVHPEKNVFHDYSSGNAGDLYKFVELKENLSFQEAIEFLALRYSIPLEYEDDGLPENRSLRQELFALHELAAEAYHQQFLSSDTVATKIRTYWKDQRRFSLDLAKDFQIGFAPPDGGSLLATAKKKGIGDEALRESGLFFLRRDGPTLGMARFRGRLMIPIRDVQGRVVAFTARQTDLTPSDDPAKEAKYVNSPETPIFHKSHLLFNLDRARKANREANGFLVVEGQLDALRCWSVGAQASVAPQGTAITDQQLTLLRRYSGRVEFLLDGDRAGQKAALRVLPMALKAGLAPVFLPLTEKEDPDDLLAEGGLEALEKLRERSLSAMAFAVKALLPARASPQEKADVIKQIGAMAAQSDSAVAREAYLDELAHLARVDPGAIRRDVHRRNRQSQGEEAPADSSRKKLTSTEETLLLIALSKNWLGEQLAEVVDEAWISVETREACLLRNLLLAIREGEWHGTEDIEAIAEEPSDRDRVFHLIATHPDFEDPAETANRCLKDLFLRATKQARLHVDQQILNADPSDRERVRALYQERRRLTQALTQPPQLPEPETN